jgi:hypothetical protein
LFVKLNAWQARKTRELKILLNADALWLGLRVHPKQPWEHDGCGAAGELCPNPQSDKDPDSVFVLGQPGKRNPLVRKTSLNA